VGAQVLQLLFVFERIHAGPEPVVLVADQLSFFSQPAKRLADKLFFLLNVAEDFSFEDKIPAIDAQAAVVHRVNPRDQALIPFLQGN